MNDVSVHYHEGDIVIATGDSTEMGTSDSRLIVVKINRCDVGRVMADGPDEFGLIYVNFYGVIIGMHDYQIAKDPQ